MSVRFDPLLTRALAREIRDRWSGAEVRSLSMDRARSAAALAFADGSHLLALLGREAGFLLPSDADPLLNGEGMRTSRFGRMTLARIDAPADERTILLWLAEPDGSIGGGVALELHTNRWNVLSLIPGRDGDGWRVRYALWTRDVGGRRVGPGEPYPIPASERRAVDDAPDAGEWEAWLTEATGGAKATADALRPAALGTWAWISALNYEWVFERPETSLDRYNELRALVAGDGPRVPTWLTDRRWGLQPYPHPLGQDDAQRFGGVFEAMEAACEDAGGTSRVLEGDATETDARSDDERLGRRLTDRIGREEKRIAALERQLAAAGPPEAARELGQILLARKDAVRRGDASVTLPAFDGTRREIALDPKLDVVGNAEKFFEEARRRERALERLPAEIAGARTRIRGFEDGLARLEREGPSEELWRLAGVTPRAGRGRTSSPGEEQRLPYWRLLSSGGLEIRVGRGARDNDELTFRHSAPDDIWMHASQVSGAHVILRWGRKDEKPPQRDLIEAAVAAAVNSGARHSGAVAVAWTRRKYVRKPRKSPPGTVTPDRVQTVMVEPDESLVRALREAADAP